MYSKPASPLPIGGVLDNGFSLYRYSGKEAFVLAFVSALITASLNRAIVDDMVADPTPSPGAAGALLLCGLVMLAASVFFYAAVIAKIAAVQNGERISVGEALRVGRQRFFPTLAVGTLYFVMMAAGYALLLIPGIFVTVAFVFSPLVVVVERRGVIESFRYSFGLVRGRWWRTAVLLTVVVVVATVLYLLVGFVYAIAFAVQTGGFESASEVELPWYVDLVLTPLLSAVLVPLFYSLLMAMYAETKLRHEGADIAQRIAAVKA